MAKYSESEVAKLLRETSHAAAAAREAGNTAEYERLRAMLDVLSRMYEGAGTLKDDLELEKMLQSPLQRIAQAGQGIAIAAGALIALSFFGRRR